MAKRTKKKGKAQPKQQHSNPDTDRTKKVPIWIGIVTAIVGILGLYFVYTNSQEQWRGRMSIGHIMLERPLRAGEPMPNVTLYFRNAGQSAATDITQEAIHQILPKLKDGPMPQDLMAYLNTTSAVPEGIAAIFQSSNHMEPGDERTLMVNWKLADPMQPSYIARLQSGELRAFVILRVRYKSRGEQHTVEYCGFVAPPELASMVNCEKWNGAD